MNLILWRIIMKLDRVRIAHIEARATKVLNELGDELGVRFSFGSGRFNSNNAKLQLQVAVVQDGKVMDEKSTAWKKYADMYGFNQDDLGKVILIRGSEFRITGLNPNRPKYPVSADKVATGKGYKLETATVLRALGRDVQNMQSNSYADNF
jgi:hypothetical protein